MYVAPSFRFAGDSLRLAGLELEDWAAVAAALVGGILLLPILFGDSHGRLGAVAGAITTGVVLRALKRGKPRGYLKYRVHRAGLSGLFPRSMRPRTLVPISPGAPRTLFRGVDQPRRPYVAHPLP